MRKNLFFIFVLSVVAGMVMQKFFVLPIHILMFTALSLLVLFLIIVFKFSQFAKTLSLLAFLISILIGALILGLSGYGELKYPFKDEIIKNAIIKGKINYVSLPLQNKIVFDIIVSKVESKDVVLSPSLKFRASIYDSPKALRYLFNKIEIGDSVELLGTIERAQSKMNPGEFDYEKYLLSHNILGIVKCYDAFNVNLYRSSGFSLMNLIFQVRKGLNNILKSLHNHDAYVLLRGLLLADRGEIPVEVKRNFVNSGVIHVLAVSGLHVGYILLIFLLLFNRLNIYTKYFLTLLGLFAFLLITGMPTSVVRATLMATIGIVAFLLNRDYNVFNSIALAALLILFFKPGELFNPGFQLSFSAVLSIVYFAPKLSAQLRKLKISSNLVNKILLLGVVTFAAQIGTLPFTLAYFNKLSVVSLFINLIVIPMVGIIIGIAVVTLAVFPFSLWVAKIFALANSFVIWLLYKLVNFSGSLEISYLRITQFSVYDSIIYFLTLFLLIFVLKNIRRKAIKTIVVALLLIFSYKLLTLDNVVYFPKNDFRMFIPETNTGQYYLIGLPNGSKSLIILSDSKKGNYEYRIVHLLNYFNIQNLNDLIIEGNPDFVVFTLRIFKKQIGIKNLFLSKCNLVLLNKGKLCKKFDIENILEIKKSYFNNINGCNLNLVLNRKGEIKSVRLKHGKAEAILSPAENFTSLKQKLNKINAKQKYLIGFSVKRITPNLLKYLKSKAPDIFVLNKEGNFNRRVLNKSKLTENILFTDLNGGMMFSIGKKGIARIFLK